MNKKLNKYIYYLTWCALKISCSPLSLQKSRTLGRRARGRRVRGRVCVFGTQEKSFSFDSVCV